MFTRAVILFAVLATGISASAQTPVKITGKTMGTYYIVTVPELPDGQTETSLKEVIEQRLLAVNSQMSTWDPESEISRFNNSETTDEWFPVSPEFASVVTEAKRIHRLTDGAFDPTVSPLIDLWGFGSERPPKPPTDEELATAREHVGLQHLEVQSDPPALKKSKAGLQLNLSAIAKGYGVDDVASSLEDLDIKSYMVDIGGEVKAGAAKPDKKLWNLGIESPSGDIERVASIEQESVATSGDYRNFFVMDGKRYSHAIDPRTGRPVEDPPASVSVRHKSCMVADALATALMVMPQDQAEQLVKDNDLSVVFQRATGKGQFDVSDFGAFQANVAEAETEESSMWWLPFVFAAIIFLLAVGAMSLGTMLQNRQIKGSCGGLASLPGHDGKSACEMCSIPRDQCSNAEVRERIRAMAEQTSEAGTEQG